MYIYIIVVIILLIHVNTSKEGLTNKPSNEQIKHMSSDILNNKYLFNSQSNFYSARNKISWIDPVIYEQIRMMKEINRENLSSVFE